ncbi:lactaldehyde reductase [Mobiluncus mulieris 28-1]|uniref:Lactaldehyde reductase n=2 Tax=Mobiluncus mulieris TaxID=2052 RepID=E0QQI2_9ACTO|nr:lactaldehyde reductase [Mobiluncus mulieris]EEZ91679.1 lactaldehyde reductase [Mobiluncus mulieris 28-1]EFM46155.1 lactaldehyde reductase [Mobiluncus mulieris ATCC 35239]MBB5846418.1 lactaldehyde reductase [Mobiluncus mulieris]MCU9995139.1 lactaldehyde reductase [Mobiluncus mulieris]MCU9997418.1 lactaldehyde reductase [Mobiluncus mulieris]
MSYRMILNQTAHFGRGTIKLLPEELKKRGYKKALLITDPILLKTGTAKKVTDILDAAGFPYEVFSDVAPNPPVENVKAGVKACADAGADVLLGLGGGSPQDTAKAVGIITTNPEFADVLSLEGVADTKKPALPIIGIPTTAGTASETTINYVITDVANKRKFVCVDPHDIPIMAIVDPDLMDSMPRALKVSTGLDALTHAIEGYITPGAWELSDAVHLTSIRMIAENLRKSADGDREAGEKMAYASYIAGIGYSNVGLGLVHGMAHPLGGRYGAPHGVANGILLPSVMRYNADFTGEKYRAIAHAFGVNDAYTMSLEDARKAACDKVLALVVDLGNPTKISEVGVDESGLDALAQDAFNDVCTPGNPRKATLEEIRALYAALL